MEHAVKILVGDTRTTQAAILEDELAPGVLAEIERQWSLPRREGIQKLERAGLVSLGEHGHWTWDNERKIAGVDAGRYRLMGVRVGMDWQGAMSIYRNPIVGRPWSLGGRILQYLAPGRRSHVVYVDYLETAPWNFEPFVRPEAPRYRGVGAVLLAEAIRTSLRLQLRGRIGLFSLPSAGAFYEKIGMTHLFQDRNRRSQTYGCGYYEFDEEAARRFMIGRGHDRPIANSGGEQ